ncbi:uncharacterized protein LOC128388886 isoform X2 [Panonychus citri]|uniref:uncharacterized protein LOC128388886 isoform X2 n=1 Tax=Panonychus citri TaxID=50023 RepID=UPI002307898F|nr:uncharacterized protein LOC128388886 isoform X2 [Panonychus citri]
MPHKLSHRSDESTRLLNSSALSSRSSSSHQRIKEIPPHRLRDNLHWRCSTCNTLVATSETGAHLIGCLLELVGTYIDSELKVDSVDSNSVYSFQTDHQIMNSTTNVQRRSSDRPRTKKLERPTPNIIHPVINEKTIEVEDEDNISANVSSCLCRKLINSGSIKSIPENGTTQIETSKRITNHRNINKGSNRSVSGWSGGGKVYPPQPPPPLVTPSTASTCRSETIKKVCNSCDWSSAPERLHSHHGKSSSHHHLHHSHNNSRVNISPTKDKSLIQKQTIDKCSKSPSVKSSPRTSSKSDINNNNSNQVILENDGKHESTSSDFDQHPKEDEDDKDDENGRNKSNRLKDLDLIEPTDQGNYSSLQMKCYLCRQDFPTDDIEIHEIECFEKWKHDNSVLPPNQRIPMASTHGGGGSDHRASFSSITGCDPAGWEHFKSQLTPCPKCSRTFFPHRLAAHEKACLGPQLGKRPKNTGQARNNVHPVPAKVQLNQYPKCTKKSGPGHLRAGQFTYNKHS